MLYGRDAERGRIRDLLDGAPRLAERRLVIGGEPGIGKTALLADARDRADDMHVLWARGVESESELAFAGLHQLLRPVLKVVDDLPAPHLCCAMYSASRPAKARRSIVAFTDLNGDGRRLLAEAWRQVAASANARQQGPGSMPPHAGVAIGAPADQCRVIGRQWLLATRLPARAGNATAHYTIKERRSAVATACVRFLALSFAIALCT